MMPDEILLYSQIGAAQLSSERHYPETDGKSQDEKARVPDSTLTPGNVITSASVIRYTKAKKTVHCTYKTQLKFQLCFSVYLQDSCIFIPTLNLRTMIGAIIHMSSPIASIYVKIQSTFRHFSKIFAGSFIIYWCFDISRR